MQTVCEAEALDLRLHRSLVSADKGKNRLKGRCEKVSTLKDRETVQGHWYDTKQAWQHGPIGRSQPRYHKTARVVVTCTMLRCSLSDHHRRARQSLCKSYGADGWSEIVWSDAGISTHIPYFKRAAHAWIVVLVFWLALREAFQTILVHIESRVPVERVNLAMDSKRLCPSLTS